MRRLDSTELDHSENEDYSMLASPLSVKKVDKREDSDIDKPRGRKKQTLLDPDDSLSIDELSKSVQESKPRGGQRGRKRAAPATESDDQPWPDKRLKEDLLEFEDEQNSPPKKARRGRPPKAAKVAPVKEEPAPKTPRRGRKKAVPVETPQEEEEEALDIIEEQDSENVEQKRKGRGARTPRKTAQK